MMACDRRGKVGWLWWVVLSCLMAGAGVARASELSVEPESMRLEGCGRVGNWW